MKVQVRVLKVYGKFRATVAFSKLEFQKITVTISITVKAG
jgi:hypothetical protein